MWICNDTYGTLIGHLLQKRVIRTWHATDFIQFKIEYLSSRYQSITVEKLDFPCGTHPKLSILLTSKKLPSKTIKNITITSIVLDIVNPGVCLNHKSTPPTESTFDVPNGN